MRKYGKQKLINISLENDGGDVGTWADWSD